MIDEKALEAACKEAWDVSSSWDDPSGMAGMIQWAGASPATARRVRGATRAAILAYEAAKPVASTSGEMVKRLRRAMRSSAATWETAPVAKTLLHEAASRLEALEALVAEKAAEKPGTYFANLLGHEWIGPDGIRYSPTKSKSPDVEF